MNGPATDGALIADAKTSSSRATPMPPAGTQEGVPRARITTRLATKLSAAIQRLRPPWFEPGVGGGTLRQNVSETWSALNLWRVQSGPMAGEAGALRSQQLSIMLRRMPAIIAGNLINSSILAAMFWDSPARGFVIVWTAGMWLLSMCLAHSYRRNRHRPVPSEVGRKPLVRASIWSLIMGAMWGCAAAVLSGSASYEQLYFLTFVIAGMAAGASAALAPLPPASAGYVSASVLPLLAAILLGSGTGSVAMAAMGAVYLVFLMYVGLNAYWNVLETVKSNLLSITLLRRVQGARKQLETELQQASNMQVGLLPKTGFVNKMEERHCVHIDAYFKPSSFVGGDYWGMSHVNEDRLAVCIVDFSGHGVEAAVNTFRLHALLSQWGPYPNEPAAYLEKLNKEMCRLLPTGKFATVLVGYIDTSTNVFCYASSGSTPPAVRLPAQGELLYGDVAGLPVGISPEAEYETRTLPFPPGAALVLFSDALIETPTSAGDNLDEVWLSKLLCEEAKEGEDRGLAEFIAADFHRRTAAPPTDDLTVVSIERQPEQAMQDGTATVDWTLWNQRSAAHGDLVRRTA